MGQNVSELDKTSPKSAKGGMVGKSKRRTKKVASETSSKEEVVVALFSYEARVDVDLNFKKGDIMYLLDSSNPDWWFVRDRSGRSGYIRRNFVERQQAIESEEWYAGDISRRQAERLVLGNKLPKGTFLIREKREEANTFALTIRDADDQQHGYARHYKIRSHSSDGSYFITASDSWETFASLRDLVQYYSDDGLGLCCKLTHPAPRIAPRINDLSYDTYINWEIPREQLSFERILGEGNFGEVWYGKWKGVTEVAIKRMKPGNLSSEAFLGEAQIMKQCDHPNLVKLYAVCTKKEPFYIVIEYMCNGSLLDYLRHEANNLTLQVLVDICAQVANGMTYLEQRKLVHRDLAARNVLVGEKISGIPLVKVADFGLARKLVEEGYYRPQGGAKVPVKWTALEVTMLGVYTVKSDVWSYGVLLYEITTKGQIPYPGMSNKEVLEELENGYRMPCPRDCPEKMYKVMLKCWDKDPEQRPTFDQLFQFFDDYFAIRLIGDDSTKGI